jgi:hypothetical protein
MTRTDNNQGMVFLREVFVCITPCFYCGLINNGSSSTSAHLSLHPFSLPLFTTMVQLKPEIYKMIVESMLATDGSFDHNTKLDQQQSLARMMQASKVSSHPCWLSSFFEGAVWN